MDKNRQPKHICYYEIAANGLLIPTYCALKRWGFEINCFDCPFLIIQKPFMTRKAKGASNGY